MITKVTKENQGQYAALFERASLEYNASSNAAQGTVNISSLDEYFACFQSLAQLNDVFTVLPLDEPPLAIDANSRQITIPESFRKNGISVQGDQIAEIVYFTIDRYYDTVDLYDDDVKIIIQWETASNGKSTNKGISSAIVKDITIYQKEGKMLFGWAVNNHITEFAGSIKFAVRFYRQQTDSDNKLALTFSLSTLTATALVNPSLDFSLEEGAVNSYDDALLVRNRYKDSVTPAGVGEAEEPEFLYAIPNSEEDCFQELEMVDDLGNVIGTIHLVDLVYDDGLENGSYLFQVQGVSPDAGIITYEWTRTPLNSAQKNVIDGAIEYFLTTDEVYSDKHVYYTKQTNDGVDIFSPYVIPEGMIGTTIAEIDKQNLYERFSTLKAIETGDYQVTVKNRKGIASKTISSDIVRIPGPKELKMEYPEGQENSILEEGRVDLSATGTTEQPKDLVIYTWKDSEGEVLQTNAATPDSVPFEGEDPKANVFTVTVPEEDRALYDKEFTVETKVTRNGDESAVQTKSFRVTDAAHEVDSVTPVFDKISLIAGRTKEGVVNILSNDILSDYVTYTWYKVKFTEEEAEIEINDPTNDTIIEGPVKLVLDASDAENPNHLTGSASIALSAQGSYYCVVKNYVNGSESDAVVSDNIVVSVTEING